MSEAVQKNDFVLPIGKAKIERAGTDATIVLSPAPSTRLPPRTCRRSTASTLREVDASQVVTICWQVLEQPRGRPVSTGKRVQACGRSGRGGARLHVLHLQYF
jgi:hypothetical protein